MISYCSTYYFLAICHCKLNLVTNKRDYESSGWQGPGHFLDWNWYTCLRSLYAVSYIPDQKCACPTLRRRLRDKVLEVFVEDLSLIFRTHVKLPSLVACACDLST